MIHFYLTGRISARNKIVVASSWCQTVRCLGNIMCCGLSITLSDRKINLLIFRIGRVIPATICTYRWIFGLVIHRVAAKIHLFHTIVIIVFHIFRNLLQFIKWYCLATCHNGNRISFYSSTVILLIVPVLVIIQKNVACFSCLIGISLDIIFGLDFFVFYIRKITNQFVLIIWIFCNRLTQINVWILLGTGGGCIEDAAKNFSAFCIICSFGIPFFCHVHPGSILLCVISLKTNGIVWFFCICIHRLFTRIDCLICKIIRKFCIKIAGRLHRCFI